MQQSGNPVGIQSISEILPSVATAGRMDISPGKTCDLTVVIPDHDLQFAYRGHGIIVIDGNEISMEKGDILTVFPGESFYVKALGMEPFGRYYIHLDFFSQSEQMRTATPCLADGSHWPRIIRLSSDVEVRSLCTDIVLGKMRQNTVESRMFTNGKLMSLLGLILMQHGNAEFNDNPAYLKCRRNVFWAEWYITENYARNITIDELASIAGFSPSRFTSLFKAILGKSPIDYLIDRRIAEAKRFMLETDLSISRIAHMVGYDDEHYFSSLFKRREGVSPSEFIAKYYEKK